jgi:hypothetical protein
MVRLAGFEPTTPWFVAKYSIHLSYSRTRDKEYSQALPKKEAFRRDFCNTDLLRVTLHRSYLAFLYVILSGLHHE